MTYALGDRVGEIEVIGSLGRDASGTLYRVRHREHGSDLALRVVECEDANARREWEEEARRLLRIRHTGVTPLLRFWQEEERLHGLVPITKGPTLGQMAARDLRIPVPVLLRIMASIAGALHDLHGAGIFCPDIGPDCLALDESGRAVLVNRWGYVPPAPSVERGFPSPEPEQDRSARTDVWGVGATLIRILTGVAQEEVDLRPLRPIVPKLVLATIDRCLRTDPSERYETAEELQLALEGAAAQLESPESELAERIVPARGRILLLETGGGGGRLAPAYREFDLLLRLGGGAFGETYRARELASGCDFAMKVLKREWINNEETVARFRREAQLLTRLSHPNIVGIRSFGRFGPSFFIAMELLEGRTLMEEILENSPMEIDVVDELAVAMGAGLQAVHDTGAIHRDVKPANIMVGDGRFVLFDFGLARVGALTTLTGSGEVLGSLRYMSPEQASGSEVTSASDIYSLGVVLYQALSGTLPHQSTSAPDLLERIMTRDPDPITVHRAGIEESRIDALNRMMDRDPGARPAASELPRLWGASP